RVLQQNLALAGSKNVTVMRGLLRRRLQDAQPSETIDELRLTRLHLLKINGRISGIAVLQGAIETLWRLRPIVSIEVLDVAVDEIAASLRASGYRCFRTDTPLFNPQNFYRRTDDVFAGRVSATVLGFPEEHEMGDNLPALA